jgi:hypothetical protein
LADETKQTTIEESLLAEPAISDAADPAPAEEAAPVVLAPSTRRGLLRWIAPVALFVGTTLKSGTAQAADDFIGVPVGYCNPPP